MPPVPDRASTDLAQRVGSTDVLGAIVDNSLDAIMVSSDERRYVWANDAAAELTGLPVGELVGRRIDDLTHPTERPTLDGVWATFLESGRLRGRFELLRPDGRTVTTEFQAIANIAPGLHVSIMRDVSEQQASEEALQRSERRLRALVGNASEMVLIVGADRRVSFASQATRRVLGYAPADVVGEDVFASFIHPADLPVVVAHWAALLADGARPAPGILRVRAKDGRYRDLEVFLTDLRADPAVGGVVLHARDVTDRETAVQRLRRSERRFRRLADNAQDLIVVYRLVPERRFEYISAAFETMTGYRPDELYACPDLRHRILHPDDVGDYRRALRRARPDAPLTMRWIHRDGHDIWVEARGRVVLDEAGNAVAIEAIVRDTTARQRAEEALRSALADEQAAARRRAEVDRLRSAFLQATSHELRTPLTSILGFSELLTAHLDDLSPALLRQMLEGLNRNAQRLDGLIADLLAVDQLGRGVLHPHRSSVLVHRLIVDAVTGLSVAGKRIDVDGPTDLVVEVDIARTQRIVENLVTNAADHTPPGTRIWIRFDEVDDGLRLTVDDDGDGIPDRDKLSVFDPFVQGDTPSSRIGGVGIGLTVVARYAELQGGHAWAEDRPGGGTRMQVHLPTRCTRQVADGLGSPPPSVGPATPPPTPSAISSASPAASASRSSSGGEIA
jgi:PAS domain S-box-containing protein